MKKLGWYAVSLGVVAFVLGGVLLLVLNLYVESRVVQHRIKETLAARLRMPVNLRKTTYTPWDGLRIDGLEARPKLGPALAEDDAMNGATFLTADSFRVQFAIGSLWQRQFRVEDVLVDRPRLSWAQDKGNRWRLPSAQEAAAPANDNRLPEQTPPVDATAPDKPTGHEGGTRPHGTGAATTGAAVPSSKAAAAGSPKDSRAGFNVEKLRVRHGTMDFLNHRRGLLGRFEDVNVDGYLADLNHARGHASVAKAALPRAGLRLSSVQTEFLYDQQAGLTLRDASANVADGILKADYHLETGATGSPFQAHCLLEGINLDRFIKEAGGKLGLVDGHLRGSLDLAGYSDDPDRCEAVGQFELVDTRLRDLPLFEAVGSALHIDDLRRLRFKTARLAYRLDGNTLHVQPLVLVSSNLQITAQGSYLLREDRLDIHARLVIDAAVSRQLPRLVQQRLTPCGDEAPASRYVDFDVAGPLNKPTSNLYQRLVPDAVNDLLSGLLHRRPKHPKENVPPKDDEDEEPGLAVPEK